MGKIILKNIFKRYGNNVVCNIDYLEIKDGEFLTLLGPSGCGKTTTLRIIAGLTKEDEGEIFIDDKKVNDLSPENRNTAMVFQSYALFPHMTVAENIAFGLKMRKIDNEEIKKKVESVLNIVGLEGFEDRYPKQLSGGQQQRVALARAIVCNPDLLLFDEPLSNLDAKLREKMRFELKKLQQELGITSIYVTHDQAEALVISDRIAVMNKGKIIQIGSPDSIYTWPKSEFVADFIGLATFIDGEVISLIEKDSSLLVKTHDGLNIKCRGDAQKGEKVRILIRPENIEIDRVNHWKDSNVFTGKIIEKAYLGGYVDYHIEVGEWVLRTQESPRVEYKIGEKIFCWLDPENCIAIAKDKDEV
ncbi:MAG: ABC transporter ATP-binding protein [Deltaproteobacteria bacterium]|nr:ABC transporter ATP-binding protein [Deltaproteobacteria bacterium]RLA87811.1 MAG: ABC transporter ATP-binding protein [Deltaproteobacteria bacterium]